MGSQGGLPLDYLFNLINGNIKMYKQLIQYERTDKKKSGLFQLFPKRFYEEDLSVPDRLVEDFIYYCVENKPKVIELMKGKNHLLLLEVLPDMAKEYMALKESEKDKTQTIDD